MTGNVCIVCKLVFYIKNKVVWHSNCNFAWQDENTLIGKLNKVPGQPQFYLKLTNIHCYVCILEKNYIYKCISDN